MSLGAHSCRVSHFLDFTKAAYMTNAEMLLICFPDLRMVVSGLVSDMACKLIFISTSMTPSNQKNYDNPAKRTQQDLEARLEFEGSLV